MGERNAFRFLWEIEDYLFVDADFRDSGCKMEDIRAGEISGLGEFDKLGH